MKYPYLLFQKDGHNYKMTEVLILLRKGDGIWTKVFLNRNASLNELYLAASAVLHLDMNNFGINFQGSNLDPSDSTTTIHEIGLISNTTLDIVEIESDKLTEVTALIQFGANLWPLVVNEFEPFASIRPRIAELVSLPESSFDILFQNEKVEKEESVTPLDLGVGEKSVFCVLQHMNTNGVEFSNGVRMV